MSGYLKFTIQSIICDLDDVGIDRSATVSSVILLGLNLGLWKHHIIVNKCVLVCMRHQHAMNFGIYTYALTLQLQLEEAVEICFTSIHTTNLNVLCWIEIWKETICLISICSQQRFVMIHAKSTVRIGVKHLRKALEDSQMFLFNMCLMSLYLYNRTFIKQKAPIK